MVAGLRAGGMWCRVWQLGLLFIVSALAGDTLEAEARALNASENETVEVEHCEGRLCLTEEEGEEEPFMEVNFWARDIVMPVTGAFLISFIFASLLHRNHISWIPESFVVVLVGMVLGLCCHHLIGFDILTEKLESFVNSLVLNLFLLPIIIYEAGWHMPRRDFTSQIGYIVIFAIAGTVISMLVVAGLMMQFGEKYGITDVRVALCYASLISAVDPVATLATFNHLHVEPLLNILVLGESIINDAVAIVLFEVLNSDEILVDEGGEMKLPTWDVLTLKIAGGVCKLLFGSIALGIVLCFIFVLIMRVFRIKDTPHLQMLFIFISCFFTYSIAQTIGMSGIVAVLFCGILMGHYCRVHMKYQTAVETSSLLKQMQALADMMVFLFVGFSVILIDTQGLTFFLYLVPFCLLGRACSVFPLSLLANGIKAVVAKRLKKEEQLTILPKHMFLMWWAGLRGGIALALVLEMGEWANETNPDTRAILRNATFGLIALFLMVFGGSTEMMVKCLGIPYGEHVKKDLYLPSDDHGCFYRGLNSLNEKVLIPLLVGEAAFNEAVEEQKAATVTHESAEGKEDSRPQDALGIASAISSKIGLSQSKQDQRDELYHMYGTIDPGGFSSLEGVLSHAHNVYDEPDESGSGSDKESSEDDRKTQTQARTPRLPGTENASILNY